MSQPPLSSSADLHQASAQAPHQAQQADVVVVIPALNEEATIAQVIEVARLLSPQVIVVSDGSSDQTAEVSRTAGAQVIEFAVNQGKGPALKAGVEASQARYLVMLDADLHGLQLHHLQQLLTPVQSGQLDMAIGVFGGGRKRSDFGNRIAPQLSGQRACLREWMASVPDLGAERWPEPAITRHLEVTGIRWGYIELMRVSQVLKEQKRGLLRGLLARLEMYSGIVRYALQRKKS